MTLTGIVVMGKHTDMVTNGNLTLLSVIQVLFQLEPILNKFIALENEANAFALFQLSILMAGFAYPFNFF